MKKVLSVVVAIAMIMVMAIPGFAMQIGTTVPTEHNVTINYNDGGFVLVNGKICADGAQFKIDRFGEIDLGVYLETGYRLDNITVNDVDVTDEYVNGNLKISDIAIDTYIDVAFVKDTDDQHKKTDMEGAVYLGDKELKEATLSFDFGSATATTDNDGRYKLDDVSEGKHFVTISKDGEVLANTAFVITVTDDIDKAALTEASDGTMVVLVPTGTEVVYLDFHIADNDGNGIPDKDPDETDPGDPDNPQPVDPDGSGDVIDDPDNDTDGDGDPDITDPDDDNDGIPDSEDPDKDGDGHIDNYDGGDKDKDNDGVIIEIGGPKEDAPIIPIPDTLAEFLQNPVAMGSVMTFSLFLILIILFKRKKDEEEKEQPIV